MEQPVLSASPTATDDVGLTVTLIENASTASAVLAISHETIVATQHAVCALRGDSTVCTQELVQGGDTMTFSSAITKSGTADAFTVVISTSLASPTASNPASASETTQSSGGMHLSVINRPSFVFFFLAFFALALIA